jgi:hypothetical protein
MDKSKHMVTVPREYLEKLEDFFELHKSSGFNIFGNVMRVMHPNEPPEVTMFLDLNEITDKDYKAIILIDNQGKQKAKFKKV